MMALAPSRSLMEPTPRAKPLEGDQPKTRTKALPAGFEDASDVVGQQVALVAATEVIYAGDPIHVLPHGTIRDPLFGVIDMMTPASDVRPAWPAEAITGFA